MKYTKKIKINIINMIMKKNTRQVHLKKKEANQPNMTNTNWVMSE